jgi:hypothetical protein
MKRAIKTLFCALAALSVQACAPDKRGCLDNPSDACIPASPCAPVVAAVCTDRSVTAFVVSDLSQRPLGLDAAAAKGDLVLQNSRVTVAIEAVDHQTQLGLTGGHLIDLAPAGGQDHLNQVSHVSGILPRDAVAYTSVQVGEANERFATVIARGHLYGDDRVKVVTRYELQPCDSGVRVRTEVWNGSRIAQGLFLADAYFWGNRNLTPFAPVEGEGFNYPALDLLKLEKSFRDMPFMSAESHNDAGSNDTSYATVSCDRKALRGFNTTTLSAVGTPSTVVLPGDGLAFERMIFAVQGSGSQAAQALAISARAQLFEERFVNIKGSARFKGNGVPNGTERQLSLVFYEGDVGTGTPWAQVVPDSEGLYQVRLPSNRKYSVSVLSYGQEIVPPSSLDVGEFDDTLVFKDLPVPGRLQVLVQAVGIGALDAEVVLVPVAEGAAPSGSQNGLFGTCAPYLGAPHGSSPACNRVLVPNGDARFSVPPGEYFVYASHGMEFSLARERVKVEPDVFQRVVFDLRPLQVFPTGSVGADFHVHGGRSFDTTIPDRDRVLSFLASGIDIIAATDHDVVGNYTEELVRLNATERMVVMPGVEMTGLVLFYKREGSSTPRTMGHFNFWPMPYDPLMPRNGAPWDELMEPGALYDTMRPLIGGTGVSQLNHPYAESSLGRDEGYARAIGYDVRKTITDPSAKPEGQWRAKPNGGAANDAHDVQEVMNGASIQSFLEFRALWLSFLKQGVLRAGTANSDSHTLNIEQIGFPRNIVLGNFVVPNVDLDVFNTAVKQGEMVGTNGPMIDVKIRDAAGVERGPKLVPFVPAASAVFDISVRAAPWIPVDELRVYVNGDLKRTIPMSVMSVADPFGTDGVLRYQGQIALSELLTADGFVHFEAGLTLPEARDLEGEDGVIDTLDFNGDGVVDEKDQEVEVKAFPRQRAKDGDKRFHVDVVSPGMWPNAFTNPFVIDMAGNGWEAPGL